MAKNPTHHVVPSNGGWSEKKEVPKEHQKASIEKKRPLRMAEKSDSNLV